MHFNLMILYQFYHHSLYVRARMQQRAMACTKPRWRDMPKCDVHTHSLKCDNVTRRSAMLREEYNVVTGPSPLVCKIAWILCCKTMLFHRSVSMQTPCENLKQEIIN